MRMAVSQRTRDCFGGDSCASTRPVVDYCRLAKSLRQQGAYQPRHSVWRSASSIPNHEAYRPRWIGLRPCNERRERQRGSARSQMQNLPSVGKFHCDETLIEADGPTVFAHVCKMGLAGIVSKRKGSSYLSGRSPDWLKSKNPASEAVRREAEEDWDKRRWR